MQFETRVKLDFYLPKVKAFIQDHVMPVEKNILTKEIPENECWKPHPEIEILK